MANSLTSKLDSAAPAVLSLFRAVIGLLFAMHGAMKLFGWPLGPAMEFGSWPAWWSGLIELVVGVLVLIGLFTREAAFLGSGTMAVAYFWQHQPEAFWPIVNNGEPAVLFCFAFFLLVFTGPGSIAVSRK